eukprot:2137901-Ditylum_brightwellii.AAC.1
MFGKIHTISDMLHDHVMEEEKPTNPSVITNQHGDIDNIPSNIPFKSNSSNTKIQSTTMPIVLKENTDADNLSTKTIIEMTTSDGSKKNILGLLDTGAIGKIGAFIKRNALASIPHTIQSVDRRIQGQYTVETSKEVATFDTKLPELCQSKMVNISAYVEDNAKGRHNIVLAIKYCSLLGLSFDFKNNIVTWDDVSMKMRQHGELQSATVTAIHPGDAYLPPFVKTELARQDKSITTNTYNKHNYRNMVWNCTHLTVKQCQQLIKLFSDYADLFDGTVRKIPGKPISLTLRPGAKPFCACAYTIPMAIEQIA